MKASFELFETCDEPELRRRWDQTNDQLNENMKTNRDLDSDSSNLDRRAQNAALRADQEISQSDIDRCRAQAVAFIKQAEALRAEMKALERSNKDNQGRRDQIEKQMRAW